MLVPLLCAAALSSNSISLQRGGPGDASFRYWAVADTFIDANNPYNNYGRDQYLSAGPGKAILIRFADLQRMIPKGEKIEDAELVLSHALGGTPEFESASLLLNEWGEGPDRRGPALMPIPLENGAKSPSFAATWLYRMGGAAPFGWQNNGAKGPADRAALANTQFAGSDNRWTLSGLGPAVQKWRDNPTQNFGLLLAFKNVTDFFSSDCLEPKFRPELRVTTAPAPAEQGSDLCIDYVKADLGGATTWPTSGSSTKWLVTISNHGTQDSGTCRLEVRRQGTVLLTTSVDSISAGQTVTKDLALTVPNTTLDMRSESLDFEIQSSKPDLVPSDNVLRTWWKALPVNVVIPADSANQLDRKKEALRMANAFLNESALPNSRFSFAPDGPKARIRLEAISVVDPSTVRLTANTAIVRFGKDSTLWLKDASRALMRAAEEMNWNSQIDEPMWLDPYAGFMGFGDSRDESLFPSIIGFQREPWFDPIASGVPTPSTDLLSATDATILQERTANRIVDINSLVPKEVILRLLDATGRPIPTGEVLAAGGKPQPFQNGVLKLSSETLSQFGDRLALTVRCDAGQAIAPLQRWQLIDAYARGNQSSAILTVRLNLPAVAINRAVNHALERSVTTSTDIPLNEFNLINDGRADTGLVWKSGLTGWFEIDLSKDRTLGEVEMTFGTPNIWSQFRASVAETGKVGGQGIWFFEPFGNRILPYRAVREGDLTKVRFYGVPTQARTLRFTIERCEQDVHLREVAAYSVANP